MNWLSIRFIDCITSHVLNISSMFLGDCFTAFLSLPWFAKVVFLYPPTFPLWRQFSQKGRTTLTAGLLCSKTAKQMHYIANIILFPYYAKSWRIKKLTRIHKPSQSADYKIVAIWLFSIIYVDEIRSLFFLLTPTESWERNYWYVFSLQTLDYTESDSHISMMFC